ncbi:MAG: type IV pilus modification PilV family protein [Sarcina sp.]
MKKVKKGMTLLEVVISLAIIAIMIIPLMNSLLTAVRANKKGEEVQNAKLLGQQFIEKLRLQDDVKGGTIDVGGATVTLGSFTEATGSKPGYYEVTSTEVDGFTIEGRVYENKVKEINSALENNEYFNKPLAGLLVIKEVEEINSTNGNKEKKIRVYSKSNFPETLAVQNEKKESPIVKNSLRELFVNNDGSKFVKREKSGDIKIEFISTKNEINNQKVYGVKLDDGNFISNNGQALGIYIIDEPDIKFEFINSTDKTQDIVVFRDPKVSSKAGSLEGSKWSGESKFNKYTNIVVDSKDGKSGLYTADLEIKKKGEKIEKIESQFYLKK